MKQEQHVNIFINLLLRGETLNRPVTFCSYKTAEHYLVRLAEPHRERGPFGKLIKQSALSSSSFHAPNLHFFFHPFQFPDFKMVNWLRNLGFWNNLPGVPRHQTDHTTSRTGFHQEAEPKQGWFTEMAFKCNTAQRGERQNKISDILKEKVAKEEEINSNILKFRIFF